MRDICACAPALMASVLVAGCGFHLQGATTMPAAMRMTYIDTEDERSTFLLTLLSSLKASGTTITPERAAATAVLHIEHDETGQRVLSVSAANKPTEYEIFYTIKYSVTAEGKELLTSQTLTLDPRLQLRRNDLACERTRGRHPAPGAGARPDGDRDEPAGQSLGKLESRPSREAVEPNHCHLQQ